MSYLRRTGQLLTLSDSGGPTFIDVSREIGQMDTALCLLATLNSRDWQREVPTQRFTYKLVDAEVPEKIAANLVDRHDRFASVLRHQQKQCWRGVFWTGHV